MKTMNASTFKAKCLGVLDDVARTGEPVTILKRGKPVARLLPPSISTERYPQHGLIGTVTAVGDLTEPVLSPDDLDLERETF